MRKPGKGDQQSGRRPGARRPLRRAFLGVGFLGGAFLAAGNAVVLHGTSGEIVAAADAPARGVAIVLGNKVFADGTPGVELQERLAVALDLYRRRRVQRIYVSGASYPEDAYDEPGAMAAWLIKHAVPQADIVQDRGGYRTAATMADAAAAGVREALICTQAYHLPRALYLAQHAGIAALGVAAHERAHRPWWHGVRPALREALARPETVVEVQWRGVVGHARGTKGPPNS